MKKETEKDLDTRATNASDITVTNMPSFTKLNGNPAYLGGVEHFHPQANMFNGTWAENGGPALEIAIKDFYYYVFGVNPSHRREYLYNLYGALRTGGTKYHAGIDMYSTYRKPVKSVHYGTVVYCSTDRIARNPSTKNYGAVGIYNSAVDKTFYYLHMIIDPEIHEGDTVYHGTTLGLQSNVGTDDDHLHFEVRDGEYDGNPAAPPTINGTLTTISPYL